MHVSTCLVGNESPCKVSRKGKKAVAGIQVLYLKIKPCKQSNIAQENQLGFNQFIHAEKVKNQVDSCKGNNKLLINWKDQPQKLFQHHISDFFRISNQRKGGGFSLPKYHPHEYVF